ncbi:MAG: helix-turn-helix domain-containing protein, partial [Alphaproteobacteria bacterium]
SAPLNLDQIADALGLSMVHVSRTLGRLRAQKLLDRRNHKIVLLDIDRLERQVEFPGLYLGRRMAEGERLLRPRFSPADLTSCF